MRLSFPALLLLGLVALPVQGQTYALRHYGGTEGVGHVRSLDFDRDGFLWLATPRGLLRYDGARFVTVLEATASQVAAGPEGTLWTWVGRELLRREPGADFTPDPVPDALAAALETRQHGDVRLFPTRNGRLAVLDVHSGLWLDDSEGRWTLLIAATDEERVMSFAEVEGGEAWVLTNKRLGRLRLPQGNRATVVTWLTASPFHTWRHVRPHPEGAWVMADNGLFIYRRDGSMEHVLDGTHRVWWTLPDVADDGTLAITVEGHGMALYLVTSDGAVRHRIGVTNGLRTVALDAVHFDGEGGLWIGSEDGLHHLEDPARLLAYPVSESGTTGLRVHPTTGKLWVGTYGAGLFRFSGDSFDQIGPQINAAPPTFDEDGTVHWITFEGGPVRRRSHSWADGHVTAGRLSRHFGASLPDGRRLFDSWAGPDGTRSHALVFGDGQVLVQDGGSITSLAAGGQSRRIWLALNEYLDTIEGHTLGSRAASTPPSVRAVLERFDGLVVRRMETDRHGRIWLATFRGLGVLYEVGPDVWRVRLFGPADGLPAEILNSLDMADGERLWLGTDQGVLGFTLHEDEPWLRPLPVPGLNAALPTEVILDLREDGDGALWVAPVGPATLYRYEWDTPALPSPAVRLTGLSVNERLQALPTGTLRLRADTTRLALDLAPRTLRRLAGLRYQYRLVGADSTWVNLDGEPTARFDFLAPGRYTFEARAVRAGQPPGPVLAVPLHLAPPFYRADWFLALCLMGLIGAIGLGARRRMRQAAARARVLEAVVADRTAELRAEKARTEQQAARLAELDEAKSRFFANISHELRTPLTLLLGPIRDALTRRAEANGNLTRQLPMMHRSGERLLGLVDQLLDLARLDAGRLHLQVAETDLVTLTRRIVLAFASRAEREGLALAFDAAPERLPVWADAERVEQMLSNLLTNAFKFTPEGGRVRVTLDAEEGTAVLTVRDTGEGIPPTVLPYVFERFRQADDAPTRRHEGAGIGLALVHELVMLHGGTVEVESAIGFGSSFTIRLPLGKAHFDADAFADAPVTVREGPVLLPVAEDEAPPEAAGGEVAVLEDAELEAPAAPASDATVLIVEDHADMRAYLAHLLAPHYRIEQADDGRAGLETARRLAAGGDGPDLVISDVMMPDLDGYALCHALKEDDALGHIPVVLLTARADEESKLEGLGEGADDYLAKPFSAEELLARCENLIEVRRRLRARFSGEVVVRPTDVTVSSEEAVWLEEVKAACEAQLGDAGFGVDWLADVLGMSTRTLQRRLKAATGLTPGAFLRTMRLERAAQLLEQHAGSVSDIAAAVGYTDAESFSRAFMQGFGVTPSAFAEDAGSEA